MRTSANSNSSGDQRKVPETDTLKPEVVKCEGAGDRGEVGLPYGLVDHEPKKTMAWEK